MILAVVTFSALLVSIDASTPRDVYHDGFSAGSRRTATPQEAVFSFGISLSFQRSCVNALSTCIGARRLASDSSTECFHCRDALAGISYWKSVINGGVYTLDNGDRIIIDLVVKDDYGNETLMKANYEELASWHSNTGKLTALFGPSFAEWNLVAAEIANKHNLLIFLWAFDNSNYLTYPRPQTSALTWKAMNLEQSAMLNATVNASRRLFGQSLDESLLHQSLQVDVNSVCGASATKDIVNIANNSILSGDQEDPATWKPGIVFRKEPNERALTEVNDVVVPCSVEYFMGNPGFLVCHQHGYHQDGVDFDISGQSPDAAFEVVGVPRGTELLKLSMIKLLGDFRPSVWDIENNLCIVGVGDFQCTVPFPDQQAQFSHEYNGMIISWSASHWGIEFSVSSAQATSTQIKVMVQNVPNAEATVTGRIEWEYEAIAPCPENMVGCRPCASSPACSSGLYPRCNGTETVTCSSEPNPDGEVWDQGFSNVFDVNYVRTTWALDALDQLYLSGKQRYVFVYFGAEVTQGPTYARLCETLATYTAALNGTNVLLYSIASIRTFMSDVRYLRLIGEDETFVVCGGLESQVSFAMGAKAFHLRASMIVLDRPLGYPLIQTIKGFTANYFLEPMAMTYNTSQTCSIFGTFAVFEEGFKASAFSLGTYINYATMQTVASGIVLVNAIMNVPSAQATSTASISNYLHSNTIQTFFGDISFRSLGMRKGRGSSTRQFVPVAAQLDDAIEAYVLSDINVVSNSLAPALGYAPLEPYRDWLVKQFDVYPCVLGCSFEDSICVPCEAGRIRGTGELHCRPCAPGKFANAVGLSSCADCPLGGECSTASVVPDRYYYPVQYQSQGSAWPVPVERTCVDPNRILNSTSFQSCRPISVCVGGENPCVGTNIGLLCASCVDGESWYGIFAGRRRCAKCSHRATIILRLAICVVLLYILTNIISNAALLAATDLSSITCALLRTMLHFIHVLACVIDATRLDASMIMAAASTPLDILVKPAEFSQLDCFPADLVFNDAVKLYSRFGRLVFPLALGGLAGLHILQNVLGSVTLVMKLLGRYCCGQDLSSTTEFEDKLEDSDFAKPESSQTNGDDTAIGKGLLDTHESIDELVHMRKDWSKLSGPGAAFASMHASHDLQEHLRRYFRECIVVFLITYPIVLQSGRRVLSCVEIEGTSDGKRLSAHLDLPCDSEAYTNQVDSHVVYHYITLIGIPLLVIVFNYVSRFEHFNLEWRRISMVLHAGYVPNMINWEALMILRTGLFSEAASVSSAGGRCLLMGIIMSISTVLQIRYAPYDMHDRKILHYLSLLGNISILITIIIGFACRFEMDSLPVAVQELVGPPAVGTQNTLVVAAIVINFSILLVGLISYTFNTIVQELNIVICANVMHVDRFGRLFYFLVRKFYRGMNPVGYTKRNGRYFIDVSKLDESERNFLGLILADTMSACFDSGSHIETWLLENAIHEGFNRAMEARQERLRYYYFKNGTRPYHLFHFFSIVKLFKIVLRPPDIPSEEKDKQNGYGVQDILLGKDQYDEWSSGVTVEELHTALATVNIDVLEHFPEIRKRPKRTNAQAKKIKNAKLDHEALVWNPGASLGWFEDYAKTWGSLVIGKGGDVDLSARKSIDEVDEEAKGLAQDMNEEFVKRKKRMKELYDIDLADVDLTSSTCQHDMAQDETKKVKAKTEELEMEYLRYSEEALALKKELALEQSSGGEGIGYQDSLSIMRRCEEFEPIPDKAFVPFPMSDTRGDSGTYMGPQQEGKAHGMGKLVYDNGQLFIGQFMKGDMTEGVLYADGLPKFTIASGIKMDVLEASLVDKYPAGCKFEEGDCIEALGNIRTDSFQSTEVSKGLQGVVKKIDILGDALVRFDGISERQWVLRENFHKFTLQAPWILEVAGVTAAIDGEYELQGSYNSFPAWQKIGDANLWLVRSSDERWAIKTVEQRDDELLGSLLKSRGDTEDLPLPILVPKYQWQLFRGDEWFDHMVEIHIKAARKWSIEHALIKDDHERSSGELEYRFKGTSSDGHGRSAARTNIPDLEYPFTAPAKK